MHNDILTLGPLTVHGYGLMIGVGIVAALCLSWRRAKNRGLSQATVTSLFLWVLLFGFLGAKLLFLLTELPRVLQNPLPYLGSDGFVVYGGILAGLAVLRVWSRRTGQPLGKWMDVVLPGVSLAQGFGRIGCFLAGCCYGRPTDSWLGVTFPPGSMAPSGVKLLPTQLFSSAGDLLICLILLWIDKKARRDGVVLDLYLILYSVGRFLIEFLRDDYRGSVGALSSSQFIAIFVFAGAALFGLYLYRHPTEEGKTDE